MNAKANADVNTNEWPLWLNVLFATANVILASLLATSERANTNPWGTAIVVGLFALAAAINLWAIIVKTARREKGASPMFRLFHRIRRVDAFASEIYASACIAAASAGVVLTQDQMREYAREAYVTASHLEDEARKRDGQGLTI